MKTPLILFPGGSAMKTPASFLGVIVALATLTTRWMAAAESAPAVSFWLQGGTDRPDSVAFSLDLERLVAVRPSGKVEVWNVRTGKPEFTWETAPVTNWYSWSRRAGRVAWLPGTSQVLIAAGADVAIHDVETGDPARSLAAPQGNVEVLAVSADGRRAAAFVRAADGGPAMVVWELGTGAVMERMPRSEVFALRRHRSISGQKPRALPTSQVFALSSTGRDFAVGKDYGEVDLWSLESGGWEGFVVGPSGMASSSHCASSVLFMPDGRLVAQFNHLDLAIYQTNAGPRTDLLVQMRNPGSEVLEMHSMGISADGNRLAIGGIRAGSRRGVLDWSAIVHDVPLGGEVQVWDTATGKKLATFRSPAGEVFGVVALDRGGKRVAGVSGIQFASMLTGTLQQTPGRPLGPPVTPAVRQGPLKVSVWDIVEK